MSIPISLKWGKVSHNDKLSIEPGTSAHDFKIQIQLLTGVPIDRQKLLCPKAWKGALKDDDAIPQNIKIPKGKTSIVVTLIGTADAMVEKSADERPRFEEDMTPEEVWKATRSKNVKNGSEEEEGDVVDIAALQKDAGMDRDDGKMEMYQYDRLVTGLPQRQINDMLVSRKNMKGDKKTAANGSDDNANNELEDTAPSSSKPLLGELAMTMGMELRRAYINSLAVLPDGTIVSGLDDGHVQLWRRGQLAKDVRHPSDKVDHVLAFPSANPTNANDPSFVTAGDGSICLWSNVGEHMMYFPSYPGTSPASIVVGSVGNTTYLAACFRITRQVDPNQFRLAPQNEAERQRREFAEAREQMIQDQLLRATKFIKFWFYNGSPDAAVREEIMAPNMLEETTAPVTKLLDMDGRLVCGDAWGGIRIFELSQTTEANSGAPISRQQRSLLQFRGFSIACMEQVDELLLAVSIQPEQSTEILTSAIPLDATTPRGIYIVDIEKGLIKAVLDAHTDTVQCICRLPDGILSAGGKMDATVRFWDPLAEVKDSDSSNEVKVVTEAKVMKQPGYVFGIKVLPDSKGSDVYAIAAARYNVIKIVI